jgi:transposase
MHSVTTSGLDTAKQVFQAHGVDAQQKVVFNRSLKRKEVLAFYAKLPPHLIGLEACGSAHYWARQLRALGHTVKLLPPRYVKAYLRRGKTDAADAEAICEAVARERIDAVPIKTEAQQCELMPHKIREQMIWTRTKHVNMLRSHLAELGLIAETGANGIGQLIRLVLDDADPTLPERARAALKPLVGTIAGLETQIAALDAEIRAAHKANATSRRLEDPTLGPISAHAAAATYPLESAKAFKSGRGFAASLGLTPRLDGTGGKVTLGPITKQGNAYLRRLLYLGAVAKLSWARRRPDKADPWLLRLLAEKPFKVAAIALANKTARIIWKLIVSGESYVARPHGTAPAAAA